MQIRNNKAISADAKSRAADKGENFSLKDECRNVPSAQSLVPHPTSCAKIFLTHKSAFLILPSTKSKFLSIRNGKKIVSGA